MSDFKGHQDVVPEIVEKTKFKKRPETVCLIKPDTNKPQNIAIDTRKPVEYSSFTQKANNFFENYSKAIV